MIGTKTCKKKTLLAIQFRGTAAASLSLTIAVASGVNESKEGRRMAFRD